MFSKRCIKNLNALVLPKNEHRKAALCFAYIVIPFLLRTAFQLKICNTSKQVNNQQQENETCCSVMIAAGPALALEAHIAVNGSTEGCVAIVQDLYKANNLPCPDMQLQLQYSAFNDSGGDRSNVVDGANKTVDSNYTIPLSCEIEIYSK